MGKSLVINGADFSQNGFVYTEVRTDASTLYYNNNGSDAELTSAIWDELTQAQCVYSFESTSGSFSIIRNSTPLSVMGYASCQGYEKVEVKTRTLITTPQSTIQGASILLFVDDNNNIKGGYTTMPTDGTSPSGVTEGKGSGSGSYRTFIADVPAGATKVYSFFRGGTGATPSPFDQDAPYKMTLIKHELS